MKNNFLSTLDYSATELHALLDLAAKVKSGECTEKLPGKVMGMLFFNSSLRTRMSFERALFDLGGHAVNLAVGNGTWDLEMEDGVIMDGSKAEHIREAAPVISRYADIMGVRCFAEGKDWKKDRQDPVIKTFARLATVPLINMESAVWHPCQALADALTWRELGLRKKEKIVLTWAWHPKALPMAVPNSVLAVASQLGHDITVMRPEPFALDRELFATCKSLAREAGGNVTETDDQSALDGAKVVYAKSWGSIEYYSDEAKEKEVRSKYRDWQVTMEWMKKTNDAKFMHCLPVRRNVIVSDAVLDSEKSVVVDQAENRLHVQAALLLKLLSKEENR